MNWNKAQTEAIELRNKNILVSAAAGSGKTAVLVERIRRLVVDEEVSIDRFLVVTFTNAAASEMKEKIVKSLTKEAQTADDKKLSYIRRQLSLVAGANIPKASRMMLMVDTVVIISRLEIFPPMAPPTKRPTSIISQYTATI